MMSPSPDQKDLPDFQRTQIKFSAHIRDPESNPAPADIEDRRMKVYRELFFNNAESLMASSFPVIKKIFGDNAWNSMIRDYFSRHQSETPLFHEVAEEFLKYLENERNEPSDPPFLLELAHYEWVELALSVADETISEQLVELDGDLFNGRPVVSPLAWPLYYQFDVHRIGPDYQPETIPEQPTFLVVYRDRKDKVGFMEINPVTARLLELLLENNDMTGKEALEQIATELNHPSPDAVIKNGLKALQDLKQRDIILGSRKEHQ